MNPHDTINKEELLSSLGRSEDLLTLYHNKTKEPVFMNRIKKFVRNPYKYLRVNGIKIGLIPGEGTIRTFWGADLFLPIADENITTLYYCGALGASECRLTRFIVKNLKPEDIFYDVGANYGFYSLLAFNLGASEIHVFEPNPSAMRYIRKNSDGAGNTVILNEVGISDTEGSSVFYDTVAGGKGGMSTMLKETVRKWNLPYREIRVPTIRLDDYATSHNPPSFLKIDVDGSEKKVIGGAMNMLKKFSPILAMEVWDAEHVRADTMDAIRMLSELGFTPNKIGADGALEETVIDLNKNPVGEFNNFIFRKR